MKRLTIRSLSTARVQAADAEHARPADHAELFRTRAVSWREMVVRQCSLLVLAACAASADAAVLNGFNIEDPLVPVEEILPGGPERDGIPAITDPEFVAAAEAGFLQDEDRVLGLAMSGFTRAYPIKILNYHEIVNDRLDGLVVVSFCPLCGTGIAFSGRLGDAELTFGVSGLLYNSDVLMYDHRTESLWSQIRSQAISGPMRGTRLQRLPVSHTTWGDWRRRYPETSVLSMQTGHNRNYYRDPYAGYASSDRLAFPVSHVDPRFPPKEIVIGLEIDGDFKAYPLSALPRNRVSIEDELAGRAVTVAYDTENMTGRVYDSSGAEIPTFLAFWFAWIAFHPDSAVFGE